MAGSRCLARGREEESRLGDRCPAWEGRVQERAGGRGLARSNLVCLLSTSGAGRHPGWYMSILHKLPACQSGLIKSNQAHQHKNVVFIFRCISTLNILIASHEMAR